MIQLEKSSGCLKLIKKRELMSMINIDECIHYILINNEFIGRI